jgi:PAS domain S-box-containing protein
MEQNLTATKSLRSEAENRLLLLRSGTRAPDSDLDQKKLVHELQVHQIELEMQNETLGATFAEADRLRAKYQELYDLAPVGYITLTESGEIVQLNRMAGMLLRQPRDKLLGRPVRQFFADESVNDIDRFLAEALASSTPTQARSLMLHRKPQMPLYVNAQAHCCLSDGASPGRQILVALMDVSALKSAQDDVVLALDRMSGFGNL